MDGQLLLIPSECYSIDTNVFIEIWGPQDNMYSMTKMPELWTHIESLIEREKIFATKEVYDELKRHASDELRAWLKNHKDMFMQDRAQIETAGRIINDVYSKYKEGYRPDISDGADPFVVAAAMNRSAAVFTLEHTQPNHDPAQTNVPKIPTVCDHYGVECVNMERFIEREGFKLGMVDSSGMLAPANTSSVVLAQTTKTVA